MFDRIDAWKSAFAAVLEQVRQLEIRDACYDVIALALIRDTVDQKIAECAGVLTQKKLYEPLFSPVSPLRHDAHLPWCDRPARWCEGHHVKDFAKGGGTSVNDGLLLCRRHHHLVHEAGWQLVTDGGRLVAIPPWQEVRPPPLAA